MAFRIYHTNALVRQEYTHALTAGQLHLSFHDMMSAVQQVEAGGTLADPRELLTIPQELDRQIKELVANKLGEPVPTDSAREAELVAELQRLVADIQGLANQVISNPGSLHLVADYLELMESLSHRGARIATSLVDVHHDGVRQLMAIGQRRFHLIIALYLALVVGGVALVGVVGVIANRRLATPLRRLAEAARNVSQGQLDAHVEVRSRDEVGQLSHAFNVMAARLLARDRELTSTQEQLRRKISETHALYQIGSEISGLTQLDPILRWVVNKARELLGGDAAALCLVSPSGAELVTRVFIGPQEVFRVTGTAIQRVALGGPTADVCAAALEVFQPERVQAHLATALRRADTVIGVLVVANGTPRKFSSDDRELVAGLATQAAIAIDNARLYEEVQGVAAMEERRRLSREIHDGLAQTLGLLYLKLRYLQDRLPTGDEASAATEAVQELATMAELAYEEARQSIFGLRTMVSRSLGFLPTVAEYLHDFRARSGIEVVLDAEGGAPLKLPPVAEVQVVRIMQEALNNVRRHAEAKRVWVRMHRDGDWFRLTVEDDGKGWDLGRRPTTEGDHFGLQTMKERAEGLGGTFAIDTAPGQGTRVTARVPVEDVP
jgi:nitrate/nitrite-specific signal transduction histidine kinase